MKERARALRANRTDAGNRIWYFLRNRRLSGYKFIREYVIENYIVDFVCRDKKLIIEIDGSQHIDAVEYDQKRTNYLKAKGYKVIRFWNNEIFTNIQIVLEKILYTLDNLPSENALIRRYAPPSPQGEKEENGSF